MPFGPCQTLYFNNAPLSVSEEALHAAAVAAGAPAPTGVKFLPGQPQAGEAAAATASSRSRSGFLDFDSPTTAALALMHFGNAPVGGVPLRLAFASKPSKVQGPRAAAAGGGAPGFFGGGDGDGGTAAAAAAAFALSEADRAAGLPPGGADDAVQV